jgi:hypothetical protein
VASKKYIAVLKKILSQQALATLFLKRAEALPLESLPLCIFLQQALATLFLKKA